MAGGTFGGGTGTSADPYLVEDAADLNAVRNDLTAYYKQTANIDLSGYYPNWDPIGNVDSGPPFTGGYDGNYKEISNLNVSRSDSYIGLFSLLFGANVQKIKIPDANVSGTGSYQRAGLLAGAIYDSEVAANVSECFAEGIVSGAYAGGFIGQIAGGDVSRSCFGGEVTGKDEAGGFSCYISGSVSNCYAHGRVIGGGSERSSLGGFAYQINDGASVSNCYAATTVEVIEDPSSESAGFATLNTGSVSNCYYDITLSGQADNGIGTPLSSGAMKSQDSYSGWDFVDTWGLKAGVNDDYPFLKGLVPAEIALKALKAPEVLTKEFRSANPNIYLWFPRVSYLSTGPGLHFRVQVYEDEAMATLIDEVSSDVGDDFYYHLLSDGDKESGRWHAITVSGVPDYWYTLYNLLIKAQIAIGPRRNVYVRASVGYDG